LVGGSNPPAATTFKAILIRMAFLLYFLPSRSLLLKPVPLVQYTNPPEVGQSLALDNSLFHLNKDRFPIRALALLLPSKKSPGQQGQGYLVYPRGDSNARARLRRPPLYPLSYGGLRVQVYHNREQFASQNQEEIISQSRRFTRRQGRLKHRVAGGRPVQPDPSLPQPLHLPQINFQSPISGLVSPISKLLFCHSQIRLNAAHMLQRRFAPLLHQRVDLAKVKEAGVRDVGLDAYVG
jgi:hypothetical protein